MSRDIGPISIDFLIRLYGFADSDPFSFIERRDSVSEGEDPNHDRTFVRDHERKAVWVGTDISASELIGLIREIRS